MGAMTRADLIRKNAKCFYSFVKAGEISSKSMNDYKMYCFFNSLGETPVMQRYSITADEFKMKEETVRKAVARMKQRV